MIIIIIAAVGLACGLLIYIAFVKIPLKVRGLEKTEEIRSTLPGLNCGACGYPGCFGFAQALTKNPALIHKVSCAFVVQDEQQMKRLGQALGLTLDASAMNKKAIVKCSANSESIYNYFGTRTCKAAAQLFGGYKKCPYGCLGLGDCFKVCPVAAISIDTEKKIATIDEEKCTGCGLCVPECPMNVIELVSAETNISFRCNYRPLKDIPNRVKCDYGHDYCRLYCPASIDIPRYVRYISLGKPDEALAVIREKIPFASVCGLVCFHPCEAKCRRGRLDEPIAIRRLKRFAAEHGDGLWKQNSKKAPATGKKVAIVGSGPTGLTTAYYLAKLGHSVTVFEALPEPGGMMRVGIPDYRLPKEMLRTEIKEIENAGVEIRTNFRIDSLERLTKEGYDAIFLALGAHKSTKLGVEEDNSPRVIGCVDFLRDVSLGKKMKLGDKVAIIGGGNAAIDSARTALRLGAKEAPIFYRRTRAEMPADPEEVHAALVEGVQIYYLVAPTKVITQNGQVGLECTRMRLGAPDLSGRRRPVPIKDSEFTTDFDTIIVAIGQSSEVPLQFNLTTGRGGVIEVNADTLATAQKGIYAGGDVVSGPASVIEAIAAGRKAAISIDKYLGGKGNIDEVLAPPENTSALVEEPEKKPRLEMLTLPVEQRVCDFRQIELSSSEKLAVEEAARCFRCDLDQPD